MTAANFLSRMNKIANPSAQQPSAVVPSPAVAPAPLAPQQATAPASTFSIPDTNMGVVGMMAPAVNELTRPAPAPAVAPFQVNPPESSLPPSTPPEQPSAATPPDEPLPEASGKGGRKRKGAAATAAPMVSDDYLEHHARQCAALQGAFANPHLSALSPEDFASFVMARINAFEALAGAK